MSGGGVGLLPRDSYPRPASRPAGEPGHESPAGPMETPLVQGPVWIIDAQTLFRRGLALLMRQWRPDLTVLDAPDIASALAALGRGPALVLVDVQQAGPGHFAGLGRLIAEAPAALVVLLAAEVDGKTASKAVELGARGYVPKSASEAVLRHALGLVAAGEVYLPREVLARWTPRRVAPRPQLRNDAPADSARGEGSLGAGTARLTPRQSEVLIQLTLGLSNKEIARSLGLLESTVKVHVKTILKKLPASNRTHAALLALELGLARPGSPATPLVD
jgi:DNA-binding NarL/FixJ family response regulator